MAKFWKPMLRAGLYKPDRNKPAIRITEEHLKQLNTQGQAMLKAGLAIPLIKEHSEPGSDKGKPISARDKAANSVEHGAGWVEKFSLAQVDGESVLCCEMDVPNKDDAEKLRDGRIKFVSPEIKDWEDGNGRQWANAITHVALTHHPVVAHQGPFREILDFDKAGGIAASLQLSLAQFAVVQEDEEPTTADGEEPGDPDNPLEESEEPTAETDPLESLILDLGALGISLPDDTDDANFIDNLRAAVAAIKGLQEMADGQGEGQGQQPPQVEQPQGVALSMTKTNQTNKTFLPPSKPGSQVQAAVQFGLNQASAIARSSIASGLQAEFKRLGAIVPKELQTKLLEKAGGIQLSLNKEGTDVVPDAMQGVLEVLQGLHPAPNPVEELTGSYSVSQTPNSWHEKSDDQKAADRKKLGKELVRGTKAAS